MASASGRSEGALLGTACGDAMGLSREGLSAARARKLFGDVRGHSLVGGRGMVSDDTEHACMVAQSLIEAPCDADLFGRLLGRRLRAWFLAGPAGIGLATLRACLKLTFGTPWSRSGVYSAGNGPAMRAPILGVALGSTPDLLREYVRVCTRITHTDPKAERGALLVALAAHYGSIHGADDIDPHAVLAWLRDELGSVDDELTGLLDQVERLAVERAPASALLEELGLRRGVSGYIYHTAPVALLCWLRHPRDLRASVTEIIELGGDTDTTAAVLGGIAGATVGSEGLPQDWIDGICDWPLSTRWIRVLASSLSETIDSGQPVVAPRLCHMALAARNACFATIVIGHGLRRLLPPY